MKTKYSDLEYGIPVKTNSYLEKLSTYVQVISDDFQSTFSVVDENTLANMMSKNDFDEVTRIVQEYIPDAKLRFIKTGKLNSDYDIYLIRDISSLN